MRRSARLQSLKRAREVSSPSRSKRSRKSEAVAKKKAKPTRRSRRNTKSKAKAEPPVKKPKLVSKGKKPLEDAPRDIELELFADGYKCVVGADEAGRGPLAGPVVAAACFVPARFKGFGKTAKGEDVVIRGRQLVI